MWLVGMKELGAAERDQNAGKLGKGAAPQPSQGIAVRNLGFLLAKVQRRAADQSKSQYAGHTRSWHVGC